MPTTTAVIARGVHNTVSAWDDAGYERKGARKINPRPRRHFGSFSRARAHVRVMMATTRSENRNGRAGPLSARGYRPNTRHYVVTPEIVFDVFFARSRLLVAERFPTDSFPSTIYSGRINRPKYREKRPEG